MNGSTDPGAAATATGLLIEHDERPVHQWRLTQLARLGIPRPLADVVADHVDWHDIAALVQRGCAPRLALRIVRLCSRRRASGQDRTFVKLPRLGILTTALRSEKYAGTADRG